MSTIGKDPQESIIERLRRLRRIPPRDTERAAQGRAAFLAQARQIKNQTSFRPPVSDGNKLRLIGWIYTLPDFFVRKEQYLMFHRLIAVFIALAVVFGGATATAFAAQNSLPADALYPLKTLTEDFRYNLSAQMESRLELALNYAARRVGEISALSELGLPTPAQTATRLGEQIEAALNIAAGLEGSAQQQAFARIMTHLQQHEQTLAQLSEQRPEDPVLVQARMMLQEQLRLAEQGLSDPQGVQQQLQTRAQTRPWVIQKSPQGGGSPIDDANSNDNGNANDDNSNGNDNDDDDNGNANGNDNDDDGNDNDDDDNGNANGNDNDDDDNGNANGNDNDDDDDNGNANGNDNDDDDDKGKAKGNDNDDDDDNGNDRGGNDNDDDDKSGNGNGDDRSGGDRAPTLTLIGLILNLAAQIF
jgi:hypothetical protein